MEMIIRSTTLTTCVPQGGANLCPSLSAGPPEAMPSTGRPTYIAYGAGLNPDGSLVFNAVVDSFPCSSEADIWLNGTGLKAIGTQGKFVSLTVPQTVENQLSLRYGRVAKNWTVSIRPGSLSSRWALLMEIVAHPLQCLKS